MMITLSSITFDILGSVEIQVRPDSEEVEMTRRISRDATLDQGIAITDGGYAVGDREFNYTWKTVSKAHNDSVARLLQTYSLLHLSNDEGVFTVAPVNFRAGIDESSLRLYAKEKLT